jgi:threonine/homoserine/homoserine lactone efflux protein
MQPILFLRGIAIGLALAAPIGPVGVLCIRRALAAGRYAAFITSLGAALADAIFGAVAALGLTAVSSYLLSHQVPFHVIGGSFLIVLGLRCWRSCHAVDHSPACGAGLVRDFLSTFLLALGNPATLLAAVGVFASLSSFGQDEANHAGSLIFGVFGGSALWWLLLSAAAGAARSRVSPRRLLLLNRGSAAFLLLCGMAGLASAATQALN